MPFQLKRFVHTCIKAYAWFGFRATCSAIFRLYVLREERVHYENTKQRTCKSCGKKISVCSSYVYADSVTLSDFRCAPPWKHIGLDWLARYECQNCNGGWEK